MGRKIMNILFLTIAHFPDINSRGVYQDLMREFRFLMIKQHTNILKFDFNIKGRNIIADLLHQFELIRIYLFVNAANGFKSFQLFTNAASSTFLVGRGEYWRIVGSLRVDLSHETTNIFEPERTDVAKPQQVFSNSVFIAI